MTLLCISRSRMNDRRWLLVPCPPGTPLRLETTNKRPRNDSDSDPDEALKKVKSSDKVDNREDNKPEKTTDENPEKPSGIPLPSFKPLHAIQNHIPHHCKPLLVAYGNQI